MEHYHLPLRQGGSVKILIGFEGTAKDHGSAHAASYPRRISGLVEAEVLIYKLHSPAGCNPVRSSPYCVVRCPYCREAVEVRFGWRKGAHEHYSSPLPYLAQDIPPCNDHLLRDQREVHTFLIPRKLW